MPPKRAIKRRQPLSPAPPPAAAAAPMVLPQPEGAWRWAAYVLALLQPALGLVLVLLYWKSDQPLVRRFSRVCLVLALLGLLFAGCGDGFDAESLGSDRFIQPY